MPPTQLRGEQIADGTIKSADIDDTVEKEFTKVRISTDDLTPDFLSTKIVAGLNVTVATSGAPGSNQTLTIASSGGGGSTPPGGSNTQIQFNDSAVFGGDSGLTFNKTTDVLTVTGGLIVTGSANVAGSVTVTNSINAKVFSSALVSLGDSQTINWDVSLGSTAQIILGGARTLNAPTNQISGGTYTLIVKQDATGARTLAFNAIYKFPGATDPIISVTANAIDIIGFVSDGTFMYGTFAQNFG